MKMIIVYLTCANDAEADKISNELLEKRLVACAKKHSMSSKFWWEGKLDHADEVLVMFETIESKFEQIEKEVQNLHSYDLPMMFSLSVSHTTDDVIRWLHEEVK